MTADEFARQIVTYNRSQPKCPACGSIGTAYGTITEFSCGSALEAGEFKQRCAGVALALNDCKHDSFACSVTVNRLEDIGRFNADVTITCDQCQTPFRFIGLPAGLDLNGASVSVDGCEGRFAIAPRGQVLSELEGGDVGFTIRKTV